MGKDELRTQQPARRSCSPAPTLGMCPGLAPPFGRSIQFVNEAIDGNKKSKSHIQAEQRNKHQFRQFKRYSFRYSQKNNCTRETNKRSKDRGDNF